MSNDKHMYWRRSPLAGLILLLTIPGPIRAEVIYDDTSTRTGSGLTFTAQQLGSEVTAAGGARLVTDLLVGVSQQGVAGTANLQARLYANDGAAGKPSTLLWSGPVKTNVPLTSGIDLVDFSVPAVLVPNTFTWTVQISNTSPVAAGLPTFAPPTVGSADGDWFGDGSTWTQLPGDPFEARVLATSTPEPGSTCLLLTGLTLLGGARRFWHAYAW
jgi:hypothetical protein